MRFFSSPAIHGRDRSTQRGEAPLKSTDILDSTVASVEVRCDCRNGSAILMRGKSPTCRFATLFVGSSTGHGQRPFKLMAQASASPRLAAHQSGRAIGVTSQIY